MVKKNIIYIGLGSNIQQPYLQIKNAIIALSELADTNVLKDSGYFKSQPMGPKDQPDYMNAVVEIKTSLSADDLLKHCQRIENQQGRVRSRRWGERTIDLDILLFGDEQIQTNNLTVPHPGICLRDFVFLPLLKLAPEITLSGEKLSSIVTKNTTAEKLALKKQKTDYDCQFAGNIDR